MCLYPTLIKNPKYKKNKKNGGHIPSVRDKRVMAVPIGCGRCAECMKKKSNDWKIRLFEEVKKNKTGHFVTLTFSDESYTKLLKEIKEQNDKSSNRIKNKADKLYGYELDNSIATIAVGRFLERWRKKHKKSVKHWLITELGQKNNENIHLHGIIWTTENADEIRKHWQYGNVWAGYEDKRTYVNEKTINYISKYITKQDEKHKYYIPKILTSKGIGAAYVKTLNAQSAKYNKNKTKDYYITRTGHKMGLPIYYRNKLYSEDEREQLWLQKLDKNVRYVDGIEIDVGKSQQEYINIRNAARAKYSRLGYNGEKHWKDEKYENERRTLLQENRIEKGASGGSSPEGQVKVDTKKDENDLSKYIDINKWA